MYLTTRSELDVVSGERGYTTNSCVHERLGNKGDCGYEGKLFEPKRPWWKIFKRGGK